MRYPGLWLAIGAIGGSATAQAQPAGRLISADPIVETPAGTQAWRVRYWTTNDKRAPIQATGVVIAPREAQPARPRPVIAWTHGTWGVAEKCAPSQGDSFFEATAALPDAVRRGYVVVAPDYPGLGASPPHGYLVGASAARSVLDAIRAARGIAGAAAGTDFAVWGESQGGHAALWTGQEARGYAPDLRLRGIAAAAPPTDLAANLRAGSDPSVRAFLTAFTAYSWSRYYGAPLSTLGRKSTVGVITRLSENNCIKLDAKPKLGTMLGVLVLRRDLKNVDLGRIEPWATFARRNSVRPRDPGVPLLIAQNPQDKIVSATVTQDFARKLCRTGARVRYLTINGQGHETSARDTARETLDWIDARFGNKPARSDCGKI